MAPRGAKPKPPGQARTRSPRVHDWIDVDSMPFTGGPALPPHRRDGSPWPGWVKNRWDSWRSMPHARLWQESDWQFALDTIELAASSFVSDFNVGALTELRYREKVMGTTWSARQDLRIRSVDPVAPQANSASMTVLDEYRNL